jgi:hypothetical protein
MVVEGGQTRNSLTRSNLTDEILNRLVLESGKDAELRALIFDFKSNVDSYERHCHRTLRPLPELIAR